MIGYRYSYNVIGFGGEEISRSADRLARLGYDAMEVVGEPEKHDPKEIKKAADDAGLEISSVCPNFTPGRDLSHPDPERRSGAQRYLRSLADFAAEAGAPLFIVAPTAYGRVQPAAEAREEWLWAVEGVREAGEYAASAGVDLSLECWNRYGTYMLNRLEEGARMWRETGLSNGGVMADTFHMNVEEASLTEAVRGLGGLLNHVHLSDSNRLAPGLGHVDFAGFIGGLEEIGYGGYLAFELLPGLPNRLGVDAGLDEPTLDEVAGQAIRHSRASERAGVSS
ncbi:TIM barrel protein [Rubrobacter tropicus]|uniref:TIM barrel protein n=1 Tax=Rubrobacter tropicus TaxID=2653851 RepID=A0A6G8Q9N4_9ACTN|nr:sugar phosphate isomerase/epimerase family protein [Rubrobacter tropicus]QIN83138.1 TIM barrel protein [Rubrobacter tropicus]